MTDSLIDDPSAFYNQFGPWAVIGGASDGTGAEFAYQLAAAGLNCVLVARRRDMLEHVAGVIAARHEVDARVVVLDLSERGAAAQLCEQISDLEIGLYVANVGAGGGGVPFLDGSIEHWDRLMNLNIHTPLEVCHQLAKPMLARGHGGLLLMCSGVALGGQPRTSVYSASKAFGLNLAESLWAEFKSAGVDVLSVVAPLIDTPTLRRAIGGREGVDNMPNILPSEEVVRIALEQLPIGPCYVFPVGPEEFTAAQVTEARRERVKQVIEITNIIFGEK